jgi:hypothetical protein
VVEFGSILLLLPRSLPASPEPWQRELTRPDASFLGPGLLFRNHVVLGIAAMGDGVPLPHQPGIQVFFTGSADGDDPLVSDVSTPGTCPSSKHLGHVILFPMGGSGSSRFDVMPLVVDGSSGVFGWSVS